MSQQTESVLNVVLINTARSFLQYVAEGWPWVSTGAQSVEDEVLVIAARQRQDVADIVALLTEREFAIDFGSFPTEYTDLQFLALEAMFAWLDNSQAMVISGIAEAREQIRSVADQEAMQLLAVVEDRQKAATADLKELQEQLAASGNSA